MKKIAKYDLEGNFLEVIEYNTLQDIVNLHKIEYTSLKRALNNYTLSAGGFQWKHVDNNVNTPHKVGAVYSITGSSKKKRVGKFYKGKFITYYESLTELAEKNRFTDITNLSRQLLKNKTVTKNGFQFKNMI